MMKRLFSLLKLCALGLLTGILGGLAGGAFSFLLSTVTGFREACPWLILLLPVGGVVTVFLYRVFRMEEHCNTNEMILSLKNEHKIYPIAAPLIFISTGITHLLGGSAGREGAALQLGGAGASAVSDLLKLKGNRRRVCIMSGMSAVFASVFGTPLTAACFVLEFRSSKRTFSMALLPCLISAVVAKLCACLLGVAGESVAITHTTTFSLAVVGQILVLAIGLGLLGETVGFVFENTQHWAKKLISNSLIRTLIFSTLLVILTAWVGNMGYNGSGMDMAIGAVEGKANWYDFLLKLLFTSVTLAAGFKGGEIVPTFCIGATFGCFLGSILGMETGLAAALGLVGIFCCATNSFVSAIFLGIELFGLSALPYMILICVILLPISAKDGLFQNRFFTSPILAKRKKN